MFLFIGEKRSTTAIKMGWTWESGHLAARTLDAALEAAGVHLFEYCCMNILTDTGALDREVLRAIEHSLTKSRLQWHVIALGHTASTLLRRHGIPHVMMIHPAARGSIRKKGRYQAHVCTILAPLLQASPREKEHTNG
jgi:hypothetical protein